MATLHFFGGEKGGVGKSFVTRTAVQYHLDRGIKFSLFDADRGNPDVKQTYQTVGCRDAIFSEEKKYEDKAISTYLAAQKKTTLVNLPAHISLSLKAWFKRNRIFDFAEQEQVEITHWFVCSGGYSSIKIFEEYLDHFGDTINHVLVKNLGLCEEWETLEQEESLMEKIDSLGVKVIDFPEFIGKSCCNVIEKKRLTFELAKEYEAFNIFDRQRVKTFLEEAYLAFDRAGVFYDEVEVNSDDFESMKPLDTTKLSKIPEVREPGNGKKVASSRNKAVSQETTNSLTI